MDDHWCPKGGEHDIGWRYDGLGERFLCVKGCGAYWRHGTLPKWYRVSLALDILLEALSFDGSSEPEEEDLALSGTHD